MTTDGYYVEATDPGPFALVPLAVRRLAAFDDPAREWQDRHADLAALIRTILAMCAHTEKHHPGGPRYLAASIRELIDGTGMPQEAAP